MVNTTINVANSFINQICLNNYFVHQQTDETQNKKLNRFLVTVGVSLIAFIKIKTKKTTQNQIK